jgi:tetratricopeptide (TPR) repeat protein
VKPSVIGMSVAVAWACLALAGTAEARNPHCAGGIQYVSQALRDKEKGNTDDYRREITKAVQQLEQGAAEDPKDLEAIGYLGWAYAEVDSACKAGDAFAKAIAGLNERGDKKKAEWAANNRDSYWALAFNDGIAKINSAQTSYPEFTKKPASPAEEAQKTDAAKKYQDAILSMRRASCLNPGDARAMRNLGAVYAFMGEYEQAEQAFRDGLKIAPRDSELVNSMRAIQVNRANEMVEKKNYDQAINSLQALIKENPSDGNLRLGLADAYFKRAQGLEGDARKPDFKAAGDAYAKAAELKPADADLWFNAALSYQSAGECKLAEPLWRQTLKARPQDVDAMSSLGSCLADLKKFDEAVGVLHQAVMSNSKDKNLHRQLGAVYTKAGNNAKGTEELMVYLALQNGQPAADPKSGTAPAGSAAEKTLKSMGPPEQLNPWEADGEKFQTWFYWSKNQAFHFKGGALVQKSDWSAPSAKAAAAPSK